jgi:hypothetical protein
MICGDDLAMGPGKADLLEAIDREGSISAAGRALGARLTPLGREIGGASGGAGGVRPGP